MKIHNTLTIILLLVIGILTEACTKYDDATLNINLAVSHNYAVQMPDTKLSGSNFTNTELCSTIRSLDILIFDSNSRLEKHQRISDAWNRSTGYPVTTSITDRTISINSHEGIKTILIIANSQHTEQEIYNFYSGKSSSCVSNIEKEYPGIYTMYGISTVSVSGNTNVSVELNKLVSRIVIKSIKMTYRGIAYLSANMSSICGYATIRPSGVDVDASNLWSSYSITLAGTELGNYILGSGNYTYNTHLGCNIGYLEKGATYSTPVYFYCYPTSSTDVKTKLILSGQIEYTPTFYPIQFNTLEANTSYEIDCIDLTSNGHYVSADPPLYYVNSSDITKSHIHEHGWNIVKINNIRL
ncbi:MAG: hypothetical protein PHD11_06050 [Bacteroidales bacterium]|nr:hypothetical protein [Bacteroidales bacterium]MDD4670927.1 hypothetical protein [Bacteroidales bacterium]